jgi:hypothetical protein
VGLSLTRYLEIERGSITPIPSEVFRIWSFPSTTPPPRSAARNLIRAGVSETVAMELNGAPDRLRLLTSQGGGAHQATGRTYRQDYVLFLRAAGGRIAFLREYFDPVRAAKALDTPILGLKS